MDWGPQAPLTAFQACHRRFFLGGMVLYYLRYCVRGCIHTLRYCQYLATDSHICFAYCEVATRNGGNAALAARDASSAMQALRVAVASSRQAVGSLSTSMYIYTYAYMYIFHYTYTMHLVCHIHMDIE